MSIGPTDPTETPLDSFLWAQFFPLRPQTYLFEILQLSVWRSIVLMKTKWGGRPKCAGGNCAVWLTVEWLNFMVLYPISGVINNSLFCFICFIYIYKIIDTVIISMG